MVPVDGAAEDIKAITLRQSRRLARQDRLELADEVFGEVLDELERIQRDVADRANGHEGAT